MNFTMLIKRHMILLDNVHPAPKMAFERRESLSK
jgi:hypothetical protein